MASRETMTCLGLIPVWSRGQYSETVARSALDVYPKIFKMNVAITKAYHARPHNAYHAIQQELIDAIFDTIQVRFGYASALQPATRGFGAKRYGPDQYQRSVCTGGARWPC
jgi:hypothetical protein